MEQTKYEIKLRERAEEFHKIDPSIDIEFNGILDAFARLSLQKEAEAYRMGFSDGDYYGYFAGDEQKTTEYLQSLGLVP